MSAPLVYANGAVITYNSATGTLSPTTGLQLDGLSLSSAVPETIINVPTISGLHLVTVYIRVVNPASGGLHQRPRLAQRLSSLLVRIV